MCCIGDQLQRVRFVGEKAIIQWETVMGWTVVLIVEVLRMDRIFVHFEDRAIDVMRMPFILMAADRQKDGS